MINFLNNVKGTLFFFFLTFLNGSDTNSFGTTPSLQPRGYYAGKKIKNSNNLGI